MDGTPVGAGKSSFDLIPLNELLSALSLSEGLTFLDVGCGSGNYTVPVAQAIGDKGLVHAIDLWEEGIRELKSRASTTGIGNIRASVVDASEGIPVEDETVDVCLMATVLHDLVQENADKGTLKEIWRVLKRDGRLAIIEFRKMEGPPGPPKAVRISPEELERLLDAHGFRIDRSIDMGEFTYLSTFLKRRDS